VHPNRIKPNQRLSSVLVVAFLQTLPVTAGVFAGQPFEVRPWQRQFLEAVYGLDENDERPVRTAVLSMARKNGKSGLAAGLALCHLCGPEAEARGGLLRGEPCTTN